MEEEGGGEGEGRWQELRQQNRHGGEADEERGSGGFYEFFQMSLEQHAEA